jgi:hypothetical protein
MDRAEQSSKAAGRLASRRWSAPDGACPDCGGTLASEPVAELGARVRHCVCCGWSDWPDVERAYLRGLAPECLP